MSFTDSSGKAAFGGRAEPEPELGGLARGHGELVPDGALGAGALGVDGDEPVRDPRSGPAPPPRQRLGLAHRPAQDLG